MSANNNREGVETEWQLTEGGGWNEDHYRLVPKKTDASPEPTRTPHATPADVTMLWEAIDQLKARIGALEGVKRYVPIPTPFAAAMLAARESQ